MRDVIIVGGGPAGSTAGALLAHEGLDVLVIEREKFPRFHIGESLLPIDLPVFERLGFSPKGLPSVYKSGADFLNERSGEFGRFAFSEGLEGTPSHAWQVERSVFDHGLLERARALGAEVREETRVTDIRIGTDGVEVDSTGQRSGTESARFVIDATGRDRMLARQQKTYERIGDLGYAAVYAHFDALSEEADAELRETGNILIFMLERGWAWGIPLPGRRLSVGFVSAKKGVVSAEYFEEQFAASPTLQRLTRGATRSELSLVGDNSYRNVAPVGARYGCIGDANFFLDPVFSSGVTFAICGAEKLVDLLTPALADGCEDQDDLLAPLAADMKHAYDVFGALLQRFYNTNLVANLFFYDDPDLALRSGLITILAGDVWRDDNPFQNMLLRGRHRST